MEVVIDYEYLSGAHGEDVIKELSVASKDVQETFCFLPPYRMDHRSSEQNGICCDDGSIAYSSLFQTLAEATTTLPICTLKALPNASFSPTYWVALFKI